MRVGLISLGCAKNLVDAEIMLGALLKDGIVITNDATQADAIIVNTCSFIDAAQEESVDAILESAEIRAAQNRGQCLIVSGCLPQRFRNELPKLLPEVDAFMGIDQVAQVSEIVRQAMARRAARLIESRESKVEGRKRKRSTVWLNWKCHALSPNTKKRNHFAARGNSERRKPLWPCPDSVPRLSTPLVDISQRPVFIPDFATPRFRLTPKHFAYVKIAEGCNHPCSFCIIPRMRGSHRSRTQSDIVAEAKALIADGVKELNLISQDSTYYGLDLRPNHSRAISSPEKFSAAAGSLPADSTTICSLLRELNSLPGDFWIRLLYTHPAHWTDELIRPSPNVRKSRVTWTSRSSTSMQTCSNGCGAKPRSNTSLTSSEKSAPGCRASRCGRRSSSVFRAKPRTAFKHCSISCARRSSNGLVCSPTRKRMERSREKWPARFPTRSNSRAAKLAMAAQHKIARQVSESFVGREIKVLVEGRANEEQLRQANVSSWEHGLVREGKLQTPNPKLRSYLVGRGEADAPDIDGRVYVRGKLRGREAVLPPGEFARVKVVGHTDYDLIAEPV